MVTRLEPLASQVIRAGRGTPSESRIPAPGNIIAGPDFSPDGRRLLAPVAGGLFDIATGARVWAAAADEKILGADTHGRRSGAVLAGQQDVETAPGAAGRVVLAGQYDSRHGDTFLVR